ncbi:MAG: FG-GAP-like repeat-containing protein, partial [Bacteroidales bacterium]|nr:FG-GAP-like repeat-containing protein [Bacteroidales bacterium]
MKKHFIIFAGLLMSLSLITFAQEEVGTLNGQLTVAPNGAAMYSIQLDLPEGRGGLTPQIALQYNSLAGDGVLGKGWGISGWSYVGREAETPYYEGIEDYQSKISRVDFIGDGFSIDGNRLLLVQQSRGIDTYRFEIDNNTRVLHHNPSRASDRKNKVRDNSYFEVQSPDGSIKLYGLNGSKQIYGVDNFAIRYYLKEVVDLSGNIIEYNYDIYQDYGELYLKNIIYSKKNKNTEIISTEFYKVEFIYGPIPKAHNYTTFVPYHHDKYEYTVSQELESITLSFFEGGSSSVVKQWRLEYQQGGLFGEINSSAGKSFLKQITLSDGTGKALKPTVFEWTYNISSDGKERRLATETFENTYFLNTQSISGDFNGDGLTDIAERFSSPDYGTCLRINNGSGLSGRSVIDSEFQGEMIAMDVNGNGADELIVFTNNEEIRLYAWNGNSMRQVGNEINEKIIRKGDFTGDGMADLITKLGSDFFLYPGKPDITEFLSAANRKSLGVFNNFENAFTGNFFGNAKTGFMRRDGAVLKLYALRVTQTTTGKSYTIDNQVGEDTPLGFKADNVFSINVGDFNGDGKDDLIITEMTDTYYNKRNTHIFYSYGNGFEKKINLGFWNQIRWYEKPNQYLIADFNNDGVSDILFWNYNTPNSEFVLNHYFMFKSQGVEDDFGFKMRNVTTRSEFIEPEPNSTRFGNYHIGDFNGNGETDIFFQFFSEYGTPVSAIDSTNIKPPASYIINQYHNLADNSSPDDVITGITNGLGVYQKISYKPYKAGKYEPKNYPVMIHKKPFTLVSKIETRSPQGDFYPATEYEFSGLMLHAQGKGLLGFQRTQVTDQMTATRTESQKELLIEADSYYFPYDAFQYTKHLKTNNILSQTRTSYEVFQTTAIDNKLVFKPIMTRSVTNQWDNDAGHAYVGMNAHWQDMSGIDAHGNSILSHQIADEWASKPRLDTAVMHSITTNKAEYNYPTLDKWIITPKYHQTIYHSKEIPGEVIEKTAYTYKPSGLPETSTFYPQANANSKLALQTSYDQYDIYGNLKQKSVSAINDPALADRLTKFEYDKTGRFLQQKTIEMTAGDDWIEKYKYGHKLGLLVSKSLIDGNTIKYRYNSFGSLIETTHPDRTTDHIKIEWCKSGPSVPKYATYASSQYTKPRGSEDIWHEKTVYYDSYGRKLREAVKNIQDKTIFNDYEYNLKGQLERAYEPYYIADGKALFTTYRYDELGRLNETILPDNSIDSIIYLGRKTLTSRTKGDIRIATETVVNIMGDTDMKTDAVMTINYNYDGKRRLRETYVGLTATEITYDEAGNQQSLIDPDAGTISYTYNAFGELTSQIDANGNHTEITYNDGRLDSKTLSNLQETITYDYDYYLSSTQNGFGQLMEESCNNGTSIAYTYDALGRISEKTETINQNSFTFGYAYNKSTGMLETYTYPSGFALMYVYNQGGDMSSILGFFGSYWGSLWKGTQQNQRGQWINYQSPSLYIGNSYDDYGYPTGTIARKVPTMTLVQDYRYGFESATGNLSYRTDALRGLTESFTYDDDDLHSRLTSWSINGQNQAELQYQPNGNISRKTDVSAAHNSYHYQHPQGKPHAVTSVTQPTTDFVSAAPEQSITYTPFNKLSSLSNAYPSGISYELGITYGPDNQRKFSLLSEDQGVGMPLLTETYYLGQYETKRQLPSTEQKIHYLNSPTGLFGILVQQGSSEQLYYVLKDHLGSITGIADASGDILEELSYDPWGRRRNANNWTDYNVAPTRFDRGYTGHEHLSQFGLINMNGRVYDPFLARFLSPDPYVQAPDYSQNYNRYSYAWNNPLKYTDPSGEFIFTALAILTGQLWALPITIGADIGAITGGIRGANSD